MIPLKEYEALAVKALREFAPVDHVAIVETFLDGAYDQDFRKVLTPAVAASISRLCEIVRGKSDHDKS